MLAAAAVVDLVQEVAQLGDRPRSRRACCSIFSPRPLAAQPRWVSRTWPTFMREGTPSGLSTMSTGRPSAKNGMSSTGTIDGDDALVAVAAGHLVARLDAALHRHVDLDHLEHARGQVVAAVILAASRLKRLSNSSRALDLLGRLEQVGGVLVLHADLEPPRRCASDVRDSRRSILAPFLRPCGPPIGDLADQHAAQALEDLVLHDAQLVVEVLADPLQLRPPRSAGRACPSPPRRG